MQVKVADVAGEQAKMFEVSSTRAIPSAIAGLTVISASILPRTGDKRPHATSLSEDEDAQTGSLVHSAELQNDPRVIIINGPQCTLEVQVSIIKNKNDLKNLSERHNSDRADLFFWSERRTVEQHKAYLKKQLVKSHILPVIGHMDGTLFGHLEIYWAMDAYSAPFADAQDDDRGFHAIVGDTIDRASDVGPHWFFTDASLLPGRSQDNEGHVGAASRR
ncbi:GNAT domain-domain-containing protein [Protomyces lactucae-debilis]|uniref:GNAT domain-domain-containing protein n=1 Tax=Protomyces lactucae-debilis TaxID=2754530 RepID=A0A1Y2EW00_PROLT|nr:GNAT domain-containing protein [Protomyces lactucae-debilis]ORY75773.1 GNAT domain-domain-containing protein [Protomyces lactucae-debilis]